MFWEWPLAFGLWDRKDITGLLQYVWADSKDVSTDALRMTAPYHGHARRIASNHLEFLQLLEPYQCISGPPGDNRAKFDRKDTEGGVIAMPELIQIFWSVVRAVPCPDHRDDEVARRTYFLGHDARRARARVRSAGFGDDDGLTPNRTAECEKNFLCSAPALGCTHTS